MFTALLSLGFLIGATPLILIFDGPVVYALVAAASAAGIAIVARNVRPGEAAHFLIFIKPLIVFAAVPVIWILFQLLPLGLIGLSHPIWESAAAALSERLDGGISIDPGATVISLTRYLSAVGILLFAAVVTVDRGRAEWVLVALTAAATFIALLLILDVLTALPFNSGRAPLSRTAALTGATLGIILSVTAGIRVFERYETRRTSGTSLVPTLIVKLGVCAACLGTSLLAIALNQGQSVTFAAFYGVATLAAVVAARRLGVGPWGWSGIAALAIVIAIALALTRSAIPSTDLTLAFTNAPTSLRLATDRVLADAPWSGTGAGTFSAVLTIYQEAKDAVAHGTAPTAAAAISIEFGRPALWLLLITTPLSIVALIRGALRRGRDSFYSAAGAATVLVLAILSFVNASVFDTAVIILAAAILGMAFAQSQSRTTR